MAVGRPESTGGAVVVIILVVVGEIVTDCVTGSVNCTDAALVKVGARVGTLAVAAVFALGVTVALFPVPPPHAAQIKSNTTMAAMDVTCFISKLFSFCDYDGE